MILFFSVTSKQKIPSPATAEGEAARAQTQWPSCGSSLNFPLRVS